MADNTTGESAFNFAVAYLMQLNQALKTCDAASIAGNVDLWTSSLRLIYRQGSIKFSPEEMEQIESDFNKVFMLLSDPRAKVSHRSKILFNLDQLDIKLRRLLQKKGMILPSKDDPRYAVLQR